MQFYLNEVLIDETIELDMALKRVYPFSNPDEELKTDKKHEHDFEFITNQGLIGWSAHNQREIVVSNKSSITDRSKLMDSVDLNLYAGNVIVTIPIIAKEDFGNEKNQRKTNLIGVL